MNNENQQQNPPPDVPQQQQQRSRILLSLPMAYFVILLGYLCNFAECVYAGFCLMISVCSYTWLKGNTFFAYYSSKSISYSFAHIFLLWFFSTVHCTYATFSFKATKIFLATILYIVASVLSIIGLVLSFILLKTDMAFLSMYRRDNTWWTESYSGSSYNDWKSQTLTPFKAIDIARTVIIFLMALIFVVSFNISSADFNRSFGLAL